MENDREKSEKNKTTKNKQTNKKQNKTKQNSLFTIDRPFNHEPRLGQVLPWSQPISTTLYSVVNTKLANTWTYMQIPP